MWAPQVFLAFLVFTVSFLPNTSSAASTASEIMALAQQQLGAPSEFARGEMKIYRNNRLERTYTFVLGRQWDVATQTENVRVDFQSAVSVELGDSSRYADNRYLLKRVAQAPPTQWLYLPALRRVRITPYRPEERVLTSHYFFYDLTWTLDLGDYRYQFAADSPNEQTPIIEGEPLVPFVPYQRARFTLERRGATYIITETTFESRGIRRTIRFSDFHEISPDYYRPEAALWTSTEGRTELTFRQWDVQPSPPNLFTPVQLETQTLVMPDKE